jgi:4-diphosphocytidyl-2-C-methyl-D-erythritol kinase
VTKAAPIRRLARAKVNLFLRVIGRRADGYHDIESLILPTSLADEVTVRPAEELRVTVKGGKRLTGHVPAGGLNLALVAALALADECGEDAGAGGAAVEIVKRIPVASGLGGGSADAAATLDALRELWGCGLDEESLAGVASRVGSDVPAMLASGPVLVRGRGDVIEPATVDRLWMVLVCFDFGVRSPDAYRWWDEDRTSPGPDPAPLLQAATKGDVERLGPLLFNDLEAAVLPRYPTVAEAKERLLAAGAIGAVMSGSGSSVVGLALDEEHATALARGFPDARVVSGPP